jgi:hypothetical protein
VELHPGGQPGGRDNKHRSQKKHRSAQTHDNVFIVPAKFLQTDKSFWRFSCHQGFLAI